MEKNQGHELELGLNSFVRERKYRSANWKTKGWAAAWNVKLPVGKSKEAHVVLVNGCASQSTHIKAHENVK